MNWDAGAGGPVLTAPRRVTVVTPRARIDVALPVQATVAEVVPQLVRMTTGSDPAGAGWVLGRLGAPSLDVASTVAGAGVQDGDILYLSQVDRYRDPLLFDDVVDAIADTTARRPGRWRPADSRRVGLGAALLAFAGAAALVSVASPRPTGSAVLGGLALALLVAGGALARAFGDATAGAVAAAAGVPAVVLAGLTAMSAGQLAVTAAAVTVYAVLAVVLVADRLAWFCGVAVASAVGAIAVAVKLVTGVPAASVAAVALTLGVLLGPVLPMLALRVGRLPLPRVPTDAAGFRRDERPTPGAEVAGGTRTATNVLTGLLAALAAIVLAGAIALFGAAGGWPWALAGLGGLGLLLRARAYGGGGQRGALLLCGTAVLTGTAGRLAIAGGAQVRLALAAAALIAGVGCVTYAVRTAHRTSSSPYWTRLLDVVEVLALVSLVPVAAAVIGVYGAIRAWGG